MHRWGHGILHTPSGTYEGQWQNDKKHGNGTWEARGYSYEGVWVDGTARCGVYGPKQAEHTADGISAPQLPVLALLRPSKVIQDAVASLAAHAAPAA
jgi:MORN repeat